MKRKLVLYYYGFQFSFTLLFWIPVFFEYQKRSGLTEESIFQIQSLYYFAFFIFDLPTGWLADRFGYLKSMKWGAILLIAGNLIPVLNVSYLAWLFHWTFIALSRSFFTCASPAYLYDFLQHHGLEKEFKGIEGRARAYSLMGRILSFAIIGFLMNVYEPLPYLLTAVSASISLVFVLLLPSLPLSSSIEPIRIREGFKITYQSRRLLFLILQGVVIFVLARIVIVNLYQPIMESKQFKIGAYGVIMGVITLFEAFGSAYSSWFRKKWSDLKSVFILSSAMGVTLFLIPWMGQGGTVALLCLFSLAGGFCYPIQKQLMNDAIKNPRYRATVLSIESLVDRAICAGVAWILSLVAHVQQGFDQFIFVSGVVSVALMGLIFYGLSCSKKQIADHS